MTKEEAEKKINRMDCVMDFSIYHEKSMLIGNLEVSMFYASDLRAIADILDQVSKEEVKP